MEWMRLLFGVDVQEQESFSKLSFQRAPGVGRLLVKAWEGGKGMLTVEWVGTWKVCGVGG